METIEEMECIAEAYNQDQDGKGHGEWGDRLANRRGEADGHDAGYTEAGRRQDHCVEARIEPPEQDANEEIGDRQESPRSRLIPSTAANRVNAMPMRWIST